MNVFRTRFLTNLAALCALFALLSPMVYAATDPQGDIINTAKQEREPGGFLRKIGSLVSCSGVTNLSGESPKPDDILSGELQLGCSLCDFIDFFQSALNIIVQIAVFLVFVYACIGAYYILLAGGNPKFLETGKSIIYGAIIGFLIVLTSWIMVDTVFKVLSGDKLGPWNKIDCKKGFSTKIISDKKTSDAQNGFNPVQQSLFNLLRDPNSILNDPSLATGFNSLTTEQQNALRSSLTPEENGDLDSLLFRKDSIKSTSVISPTSEQFSPGKYEQEQRERAAAQQWNDQLLKPFIDKIAAYDFAQRQPSEDNNPPRQLRAQQLEELTPNIQEHYKSLLAARAAITISLGQAVEANPQGDFEVLQKQKAEISRKIHYYNIIEPK